VLRIPALARHAVWFYPHPGTGALLYGILVRMPVHKHVTFVVFNLLIAWDLPADSGIPIRAEESETTMLYYSCSTCKRREIRIVFITDCISAARHRLSQHLEKSGHQRSFWGRRAVGICYQASLLWLCTKFSAAVCIYYSSTAVDLDLMVLFVPDLQL